MIFNRMSVFTSDNVLKATLFYNIIKSPMDRYSGLVINLSYNNIIISVYTENV